MGLGGEAGYLKSEINKWAAGESTGGPGKPSRKPPKKPWSRGEIIAFFVCLVFAAAFAGSIIAIVIGLSDSENAGSWNSEEETEYMASEENTAADGKTEENLKEVKITENYSFYIPEDAEDISDIQEDLPGFTQEKCYETGNGVLVRSYIAENEPDCFPRLVEHLYEGTGIEPGYRFFFNTALAATESDEKDANGNSVHCISYYWPDGGDTLCCLEVFTYDEKDRAYGEKLINSVTYKGMHYKQTEPPYGMKYPTEDAMDKAMLRDAQNAWERELQQQYEDQDESPGFY